MALFFAGGGEVIFIRHLSLNMIFLYLSHDAHADVSVSGLNFYLGLNLYPYLVYASSEGSGESAHLRRLTRAFTARQGNKYQHLMYKPIYPAITSMRANSGFNH